ncbi:lysophosphatidic acid phosphatase type 6-like [Clavelina lepadiformis]|uniref:lysophosphatidic acid phosphatase type 6-like n=1 Tax=Clavelina lepadiformis TaxID=159417 RepID=UPI004041EDFD
MPKISFFRHALLFGIGSSAAMIVNELYKLKESKEDNENTIEPENLKLKLVQVVFRHGARTPLSSPDYLPHVHYDEKLLKHASHTFVPYKIVGLQGDPVDIANDSRAASSTFPHGQLTALGAEQMFGLGTSLRKRYIATLKFLPEDFSNEVFVRSTRVRRAVESARCTLAGLYPDEEIAIPIHLSAFENEVLYPNFLKCKYLKSLTRWSWIVPDLIEGMKNKREEIQVALGIPPETNVHIVTLRDCLCSHKFHGVLPAHLNLPEVLEQAEEAAKHVMDHVFAGYEVTREMALKLGIGPLLGLFLKSMESSIEDTSAVKLCMYSGHDTTLMPLLHALGIDNSAWVPFGANITLELYERAMENGAKDHYVRVLYEHQGTVIPGCSGEFCPLNEFRDVVSQYLITEQEFDTQCNVKMDTLLESVPKVAEIHGQHS